MLAKSLRLIFIGTITLKSTAYSFPVAVVRDRLKPASDIDAFVPYLIMSSGLVTSCNSISYF